MNKKTSSHQEFKPDKNFECVVKQTLNTLSSIQKISSSKDVALVERSLEYLLEYLPGPITIQKLANVELDQSKIDWKCYLLKNHSDILHELIRLTDNNWPVRNELVDQTVLKIVLIEEFRFLPVTLVVFLNNLKISNYTQKEMITLCIQEILESDVIFFNILNYVLSCENSDTLEDEFSELVQTLISLPNRVFNIMGKSTLKIFIPETFGNYLLKSFIQCAHFLNDSQFTYNAKRLAHFLSRIIVNFKGSAGLLKLIDLFSIWCDNKSFIYIIQNILLNLDHQAISVFSVLLLIHIPFDKNGSIYKILGPNLIKDKDWLYHITSKIPFAKFFSDNDNLIKNLVKYLQLTEKENKDSKVLYNLIKKLLEVWSSETACKQTTLNQHIYITKLLLLAVKFESNILSLRKDQTLTSILYDGVAVHLKSSLESYRYIGMYTAENVFSYFNAKDGPELKFDYDSAASDIKSLLADLKNVIDCDIHTITAAKNENDILVNFLSNQKPFVSHSAIKIVDTGVKSVEKEESDDEIETTGITIFDGEDLDSDDDLVPCDMSNEKKYSKISPPMYLKDLRDGLLETENAEIFAVNFDKAEELILSQLPHSDPDTGLEILQILINNENKFYVEDYEEKHFQTCTTIVTIIPKESAEFLAGEFHTEATRYSVNLRVYILDILAEAARRISSFKKDIKDKSIHVYKSNNVYQKPMIEDPRIKIEEIIHKRLEAKTRRITSKIIHPFLHTKVNEFNKVANSFFYPLLYGLSKKAFTLSVSSGIKFDTDHILLVHFLDTISVIILCSRNLPMVPKFAEEILQFIWFLRFHSEPKVRLAVMNTVATVIISTPVVILQSHLFEKLLDIRDWLINCVDANVVQGIEPNSDCKVMAARVLTCLDCIVSEGLPILKSNNYLE